MEVRALSPLERRAQRGQLSDQVFRFHMDMINNFAYFGNTEKTGVFIMLSATPMFWR